MDMKTYICRYEAQNFYNSDKTDRDISDRDQGRYTKNHTGDENSRNKSHKIHIWKDTPRQS